MHINNLNNIFYFLNLGITFSWALHWEENYDYVIVGGGAAGCVVANRLSEDPDVSVLLLEAGPDPKENSLVSTPRAFLDVYTDVYYDWGYATEPQQYLGSNLKERIPWQQGKMLGGSGSHNAMFYTRGSRHDYDRWANLGNKGWGYKDVLPYFLKSEKMHIESEYANFVESEFHGFNGGMQTKVSYTPPLFEEIIKGGKEIGFDTGDYNGNKSNIISPVQVNVDINGERSSTLEAFLRPVMYRNNLDVITNAIVTKIKLTQAKESTKADGVFFVKNGTEHYVKATHEVIVSTGGLNSPKLLMLSGIGPKQHLEDMNIEVFADLPVGNNLENHYAISLLLDIDKNSPMKLQQLFSVEALFEYLFTGKGSWSSGVDNVLLHHNLKSQPKEDLFPYMEQSFFGNVLSMANYPELLKAIKQKSKISSNLLKEFLNSKTKITPLMATPMQLHSRTRGTVRLRSNNPFDKIVANYLYLDHEEDRNDYVEGIRMLQKLVNTTAFKNAGIRIKQDPFPKCLNETFDSDEYWKCFIKYNIFTHHQFSCTCKMAQDSSGVVDDQLRVKGVYGLRVVDASIMPQIVSGHTHAATVMIAEKASDMIKQQNKAFNNNNTHKSGCISKATILSSSDVTRFTYFTIITLYLTMMDVITVS